MASQADWHRVEGQIEDFFFMLEHGETRERACERLGVSWPTMQKNLKRHRGSAAAA